MIDGAIGRSGRGVEIWLAAAAAAVLFIVPLLLPVATVPWLARNMADVVVAGSLAIAAVAAIRARDHRRGAAVLAIITAGLFGTALALKWQTGLSSDVLKLGLFPALDAESYVTGAVQLAHSGMLNEFASHRPLMATYIAGLFLIDGGDLRLTTAVLTALCAVGSIMLLVLLHRRLGMVGAAAALAAVFPFLYPTVGTAMTESMGFALGAAAFVMLWEGAERDRPWLALSGLAVLGVGLVARSGAMFALPTLAIWFGLWRGRERFSWRWAALAVAAGGLGFVLNKIVLTAIGFPGQVPFANFAYTAYGLVAGGRQWDYVLELHPELRALSEGDQAGAIFRLAWEHFLDRPLDLVRGTLVRYNDFLFSIRWHRYVPNSALRCVVLALSLIGVAAVWRRRREPVAAMLLAAFAGIMLSVPFLSDGGPRVHAATHCVSAALVALGAAALTRRRWWPVTPDDEGAAGAATNALAVLAAASVAVVLAPLAAIVLRAPSLQADRTDVPPCDAPARGYVGYVPRGSTVVVCPPGSSDCRGVNAADAAAAMIWNWPEVAAIATAERPLHVAMVFPTTVDLQARFTDSWFTDTSHLVVSERAIAPGAIVACIRTSGALNLVD